MLRPLRPSYILCVLRGNSPARGFSLPPTSSDLVGRTRREASVSFVCVRRRGALSLSASIIIFFCVQTSANTATISSHSSLLPKGLRPSTVVTLVPKPVSKKKKGNNFYTPSARREDQPARHHHAVTGPGKFPARLSICVSFGRNTPPPS